jgi:hypothetical protein
VTASDRAAVDREIAARVAYVELVRVLGEPAFMRRLRQGWMVRSWTGWDEYSSRKRDAVSILRGHVRRCAERLSELRAQLEADALDAEIAATPIGEREASARAQREAIDGPRWKARRAS